MVRFTCFASPIHCYKTKKSVHRSAGAMDKNSQDSSQDRVPNISYSTSNSNIFQQKSHEDNLFNARIEQITSSPSAECRWKSEELSSNEDNSDVPRTVWLKKSQSLGSGLDRKGHVSFDVDEDHSNSPDENSNLVPDDFNHNRSAESSVCQDYAAYLLTQCVQPVLSESSQKSDGLVHAATIFSIDDSQQMEIVGQEDFDTNLSLGHIVDYGSNTLYTPSAIERIVKSCSFPDVKVPKEEGLPSLCIGPRSNPLEPLNTTDARRGEFLSHEGRPCFDLNFFKQEDPSLQETAHILETVSNPSCGLYEVDDEGKSQVFGGEKLVYDNEFSGVYDCHSITGVVREWALSEIDKVDVRNISKESSSIHNWNELSNKDFNNKRIEDWINKIDLQNRSPLHDVVSESPSSNPKAKNDSSSVKFDVRTTPGMEIADRYISSLTAMSTSAQMANLGLAVIPLMSAYSSLRVLNLSCNGIVRITAGALPRGLHLLNLSKNVISNIEGLRELTHLRVLDFSYNRICKIGHGLGSCSSLKELYLAGNKISEVEGLHRLLKLTVLDLRYNKISTAKCLDQLAANYGSLQAIYLEGNPAQRNVGEEQLKKYLVGLLPHLVYLNRPIMKSGSLKEIVAYQSDRSLRSEHKLSRRGSHNASAHKSSSLTHSRSSPAVRSPKQSKGRHGRLPPSKLRETQQQADISSSTRLSPRSSQSIRRSRSEGKL